MPSTTFTYTAQQGQRIASAAGKALGLTDEQGLPRSATAQETNDLLIKHIKGFVRHWEEQEQKQALPPITDVEIT
jgi:hypothetical protein